MPARTERYERLKLLEKKAAEVHRALFAALFAQEEAVALELELLRQELEKARELAGSSHPSPG